MTAYRERTNAELIQAIRDEDKGLGEHAMLSARIIHNNVVVMQAAYLEAKAGKGDDVAVAWIENLLIDSDNVPEEEYGGAGDLQNAHDPDLYFRDNHLDGELSPYQSRMAPLIDELARQLESVTAERDRLRAERQELERQEPIKYLYRVINCFGNDVLRDDPKGETIIETIPLYARHVPAAPAVPDEWREVLSGLLAIAEKKGKKQGSPNHSHLRPGIWDDDNGPVLSGKPCAECAMYDKARALLQSAAQSGSDPVAHHPV